MKIDKAFVNRLSLGRLTPVIAAITALADALGLSTVAEGIEEPAQATVLAAHGVIEGQGWLYGKAAPLDDLKLPHYANTVDLGSVGLSRQDHK